MQSFWWQVWVRWGSPLRKKKRYEDKHEKTFGVYGSFFAKKTSQEVRGGLQITQIAGKKQHKVKKSIKKTKIKQPSILIFVPNCALFCISSKYSKPTLPSMQPTANPLLW